MERVWKVNFTPRPCNLNNANAKSTIEEQKNSSKKERMNYKKKEEEERKNEKRKKEKSIDFAYVSLNVL